MGSSNQIQSNKSFEKKLIGYSLMAGAAIAVGAKASHGSVVYVPSPYAVDHLFPFNPASPGYLDIDFDGNGSTDVHFTASSTWLGYGSSVNLYAQAQGLGGLNMIGAASSIKSLNNGDLVDNAAFGAFGATANGNMAHIQRCYTNSTTQTFGEFKAGNQGYVGVRFDIGGLTHFGWIDVTGDPYGITINGWAYEDQAGTPIVAGSTESVAPVPLPGTLSLLASGAAGLLAWKHGRKKKYKF